MNQETREYRLPEVSLLVSTAKEQIPMKKLLIIAGFAVLASCGGKTVYVVDSLPEVPAESVPETKAPKTTPAPTRPPASYSSDTSGGYDEDAFFFEVRMEAPVMWSLLPRTEILNMGLVICETFDSGATITEVSEMLVASMMSTGTASFASDVATVTGASLLYLCPEHSWWLNTL